MNVPILASPPPDPEQANDQRAEWADEAVSTFMLATGADHDDAVCDLLADLMHWCDRMGMNFDHELTRALNHYNEETRDVEIS